MESVKFSVVPPAKDPWSSKGKWKPLMDSIKQGNVCYVPLFPNGYPDTCSQVHNTARQMGLRVTTKKNGAGIYVKAKKR